MSTKPSPLLVPCHNFCRRMPRTGPNTGNQRPANQLNGKDERMPSSLAAPSKVLIDECPRSNHSNFHEAGSAKKCSVAGHNVAGFGRDSASDELIVVRIAAHWVR